MAFPTTSVLTTFTGADEDPISEGGNWSGPITSARGRHKRASNRITANSTGSGTKQSYWTPATYLETEVYATIGVKGSASPNYFDLIARIQGPTTATPDFYALEVTVAAGTDGWTLYRVINGAGTLIDTMTATEVAVGDAVGLEVLGSGATVTLNAYRKPSAGAWTLIDTFADMNAARIVAAGSIGLEQDQTLWALDDFGGGEVAGAPATSRSGDMLLVGVA